MTSTRLSCAVTGGFGYSGRYVVRELLERGQQVVTLTNSAHRRRPSDGDIEARPLAFDEPDRLVEALKGVDVLVNTYWVRFNHRSFTHGQAVGNTLSLFDCAKRAGVGRIVHVSITNPDADSPLEYFSGKARLETALRESGLRHAVLRPAVLFGGRDILINNIAWFLRHLPVFGVPGDGSYRLQPIHVEDFAQLAADAVQGGDTAVIDAIGPETFSFRELVETLREILGLRRAVVSVPPSVALWATRLAGLLVGDVVLTREEIHGLMAGTLCVDTPPTGSIRLTDWARQHRQTLGRVYANELARRTAP